MQKKQLSTDVTSMVTTPSLAKQLASDFPDIKFTLSTDVCAWNAQKRQILYKETTPPVELLHEVGHALLGHTSYTRDIELVRIEREAWEHASTVLAPRYNCVIDEETVESALDTYREWLHSRSTCPACGLNGIQDSQKTYKCIHCHEHWAVNDARICQLRRTRLTTK